MNTNSSEAFNLSLEFSLAVSRSADGSVVSEHRLSHLGLRPVHPHLPLT